jgi:hypothetical protein
MNTIAQKIGLSLAALHCIGVVVTAAYINRSTDPQAPLLWGIFAILDFPVSLLYFCLKGAYTKFAMSFDNSFIAQLLYPPHIIHGLIGGIWWYYLPRFFMSKISGGVWGKEGHMGNRDRRKK